MSEIEALQARVAAAQAQLGKAHENRHEQSARLAELIDSVEKTLAAKQLIRFCLQGKATAKPDKTMRATGRQNCIINIITRRDQALAKQRAPRFHS